MVADEAGLETNPAEEREDLSTGRFSRKLARYFGSHKGSRTDIGGLRIGR